MDSTASAVEDGGVQNISRIKIYRTPIKKKSSPVKLVSQKYRANSYPTLLIQLISGAKHAELGAAVKLMTNLLLFLTLKSIYELFGKHIILF